MCVTVYAYVCVHTCVCLFVCVCIVCIMCRVRDMHCGLLFYFLTDLNTGLVLWVQQFYALLVKRFLHSIRNWRAIITQVVLPTIFILLGLILVETIPAVTEPDELRSMSLQESALVDDDIVTFYAEFGSGPQIFEVIISVL